MNRVFLALMTVSFFSLNCFAKETKVDRETYLCKNSNGDHIVVGLNTPDPQGNFYFKLYKRAGGASWLNLGSGGSVCGPRGCHASILGESLLGEAWFTREVGSAAFFNAAGTTRPQKIEFKFLVKQTSPPSAPSDVAFQCLRTAK